MANKILLVADLENWVLGNIARKLSSRLKKEGYIVKILYSHSENFLGQFKKAQKHSDLAHFLSPWDFFELYSVVFIPSVVTLWHMVEWSIFLRYQNKIDALLVPSKQWYKQAKHNLKNNSLIFKFICELDSKEFSFDENSKSTFLTEKCLNLETIVFGFAGSAWSNEAERKGLDRLWECLTHLKEESNKDFVLRITGKYWSDDIVPESLKENVVFTLDLPDSLLPNFYSSLDYYICTSRCEGVPYPVIEAMSCERVVLSTSVGVAPEVVVNNLTGFLLDEEDIKNSFLEAFKYTSDDLITRKKIGALAREQVIRCFASQDSSVKDFFAAYAFAEDNFSKRSFYSRLLSRVISEFSSLSQIVLLKTGMLRKYKFVRAKFLTLFIKPRVKENL